MGGGGLRILPHKKWHVWRRDNIERVLRDEREYEEQQQTHDAKQRRLEQERRAEQLRAAGDSRSQEHVNLFEAEEALALALAAAAKSRGAKKKKTDDTLARHGKLPWYAQAEENEPTARQERKRKRELEGADPLRHMRPKERPLFDTDVIRGPDEKRGRRGVDEGPAGSDRRKYSGRYDRSSTPEQRMRQARGFEERGSKKRRKHHKKEKKSKKEALLEQLRRERDDREASERRRANKLMYK